jgi:hypothetical protein
LPEKSRSDVEKLPGIGEDGWRDNPIEGNKPNEYVALDQIMLDHADRATAEALCAINAEFGADIQSLTVQLVESILPALGQMQSRILQKSSEREDAVRDLLNGRTAAPDGAKADPEDAAQDNDDYKGPSGP